MNGLSMWLTTTVAALMLSWGVAVGHVDAQARARLGFEEVRRIALQHVPSGHVESIEYENEHGREVYEVEVRDERGREHELVIDAYDGRVISARIDDD